MRDRAAVFVAALSAGIVAGELDGHAVGIDHVDRAAIAVLERVGRLEARSLDPPLDLALSFLVDIEREVDEWRRRYLGPEQCLVFGIGELEERQRAAVADAE